MNESMQSCRSDLKKKKTNNKAQNSGKILNRNSANRNVRRF